MTRIYHIVRFTYDNSLYIFFHGCNFHCLGCILKLSPWDCHLTSEYRRQLESLASVRTLNLNEMQKVIEPLGVRRVVLGGGEPTIDEEIVDIVMWLNSVGIRTILLTNGYALNKDMVEELKVNGLDEVCVSIKAFTDTIHIGYTGRSNENVLNNFKLLYRSGVRLRAESVLIPGLVEANEIERIARFIASMDSSISYRIDGYTSVPGASWRQPSQEEIFKAVRRAEKHLENVCCIYSEMKLRGNVLNVYPPLQEEL